MRVKKYTPDLVITTTEDVIHVSLIVARLAAQKGYDIFCKNSWTHYHKKSEYYKKDQIQFMDMSGSNSIHKGFNNEYYTTYSAPAQESLKTWLRREHKIEVEVNFDNRFKDYNYRVFSTTRKQSFLSISSTMAQDAQKHYEIAFEHALKAALDKLPDQEN